MMAYWLSEVDADAYACHHRDAVRIVSNLPIQIPVFEALRSKENVDSTPVSEVPLSRSLRTWGRRL